MKKCPYFRNFGDIFIENYVSISNPNKDNFTVALNNVFTNKQYTLLIANYSPFSFSFGMRQIIALPAVT